MFANKHILVVDDNAGQRKTLAKQIQKHMPGVEIDEAVNGLEAVEKAKKNQYECIFIDGRMPEMEGWVAVKTLHDWYNAQQQTPPKIFSWSTEPQFEIRDEKTNERILDSLGRVQYKPFEFADAALTKPNVSDDVGKLLVQFKFINEFTPTPPMPTHKTHGISTQIIEMSGLYKNPAKKKPEEKPAEDLSPPDDKSRNTRTT